jgi:hypothetical protein
MPKPKFNVEQAFETVLNVLGNAGIKPSCTSPSIQVMESIKPRVIRALHQSGFHRTNFVYDEHRYLAGFVAVRIRGREGSLCEVLLIVLVRLTCS